MKEKDFLEHLLNITAELPSLNSAKEIFTFLSDYFYKNGPELQVEFFYATPDKNEFCFLSRQNNFMEQKIKINKFSSIGHSRNSGELATLSKEELKNLDKTEDTVIYSFPLVYNDAYYGNLLLSSNYKNSPIISFGIKYINILSRMIANSLQNIYNLQQQKIENNKKTVLIKELSKLQKNEASVQTLPIIFHTLKNILTPILGYSQILLCRIKDPVHRNRIEKIEKNTNKLTNHLNLLKEHFASFETNKERLNLNHIIKNMTGYFNELKSDHNIQIKFIFDPDLPEIELSQFQIETMIENFCDNAVDAIRTKGGEGGVINIKTENYEEFIKLSILDNGIGMEKEELLQVTTPFFSTYQNKPGIGLTVCEKIVNNHGGSFHYDSIPHKFTRVEILFYNGEKKRF